jgi:NAD-dependent dihydropyrimidine dehydrogenase PreA subunit
MMQIDRERCTGCGACMEACPNDAIEIQDGFAHVLAERCTECGTCVEVCPQGAVLLLAEAASAADSQERAIAKSEGQPADRSPEVITVRVPPPSALVPARPAPVRQLGLALGAALSYLGREVAPRLVRLAVDWVEERIAVPQKPASRGTLRGSGGRTRQRRQRRGR